MSAIDKAKLPNSTTFFGGLDLKRADASQGLDYKLGDKNIDVKLLTEDLLSNKHLGNIKAGMNTTPNFVLLLDERGANNNPELLNQLVTKLSSGNNAVSNPRQYITEVQPNDFVKLRAGDMALTATEF